MEQPLVVVFGEAVVDLFSDNTSSLGGTGFNAAFHLHQIGRHLDFRAELVTRVGNDEYGERIRDLFSMGKLIQVHPYMPTGVLYIDISTGDTIGKAEERTPIPWEGFDSGYLLREAAIDCKAVIFGTIAQSIPQMKVALNDFMERAQNAIRLYDLNLRTNDSGGSLFETKTVIESIAAATIVKMNVAELVALSKMVQEDCGIEFGVGHSLLDDFVPDDLVHECVDMIQPLIEKKILVLTAGSKGTSVYRNGKERFRRKPFWKGVKWNEHSKPAGAGDACTAGLLAGFISGWSIEDSIDLANIMGAFVSSQPTASPIISDEVVDFLQLKACFSNNNNIKGNNHG